MALNERSVEGRHVTICCRVAINADPDCIGWNCFEWGCSELGYTAPEGNRSLFRLYQFVVYRVSLAAGTVLVQLMFLFLKFRVTRFSAAA